MYLGALFTCISCSIPATHIAVTYPARNRLDENRFWLTEVAVDFVGTLGIIRLAEKTWMLPWNLFLVGLHYNRYRLCHNVCYQSLVAQGAMVSIKCAGCFKYVASHLNCFDCFGLPNSAFPNHQQCCKSSEMINCFWLMSLFLVFHCNFFFYRHHSDKTFTAQLFFKGDVHWCLCQS